MNNEIIISVVIPTCNRKSSLLRLLGSLSHLDYPLHEVIIVDSGTERLVKDDFNPFNLNVLYLHSEKSVCVQRNTGVRSSKGNWIFLCDDDIEVPEDYISTLVRHIGEQPAAGCVSGMVLQRENDSSTWSGTYPVTSWPDLLSRFIFQVSIWGEIKLKRSGPLSKKIIRYYGTKGNHITKAGWPVVTDYSGTFFKTPVYGLGASLVRKEWLESSPYDEVLDPNGIGDNYGVAAGFPPEGIHVVPTAFVFHHRSPENRPIRPQQHYRRMMALDYFIKTRPGLIQISRFWFLWSLFGNLTVLLSPRTARMFTVNLKLIARIMAGANPYLRAKRKGEKIVSPEI